jgi:hypothetical protein
LNPHGLRRHPLKMVCLPIPPLPHSGQVPQPPCQGAAESILRGTHDQSKDPIRAATALEPEMPEDSEPEAQEQATLAVQERSASGPAWRLPSQNFPGRGS